MVEPATGGICPASHASVRRHPSVYVAGRFQSYAKVRSCIDAVHGLGCRVTYDWTRTPEFDADGHPLNSDGAQPKTLLQQYAANDIQGVREAEVFIMLADDSLAGAYIEMGIALERGIPIIVVAPERWTIFLECPTVAVAPSLAAALQLLESVATACPCGAAQRDGRCTDPACPTVAGCG